MVPYIKSPVNAFPGGDLVMLGRFIICGGRRYSRKPPSRPAALPPAADELMNEMRKDCPELDSA